MDKDKLLIKFGVTFNYNAAFLYYNLRGILAEKWGHDYYKKYGDRIEHLFLENIEEKRFCLYGLKFTEIVSEDINHKDTKKELSSIKELIDDIIKSIRIVKITLIRVYSFYLYIVKSKDDLFNKINENFIKLKDNFFPLLSNYNDIGIAFTFNLNKYEHELSFGPLADRNIKQKFKYDIDEKFKTSLLFNLVTSVKGENVEKTIEGQSRQIKNVMDMNMKLGKEKLSYIIETLGV